MTCLDVDQFLHPYLDGEFEPAERLEVEAHLSECQSCARRVHKEARFREAMREQLRLVHEVTVAPPSLRQNVLEGVRRQRRWAAAQTMLKASAAMLVVASASGAYLHLRPSARQRYVDDATAHHSRGLPVEIDREPGEVEAWFRGKLDHRVSVPQFDNARLAGARLSNVRERVAAQINYELATSPTPRRMGLFVFGDPAGEVDAQPLPEVSVSSSRGYNVAVWRDGIIVYQLVTDLDEADIRRMVTGGRAYASPARQNGQRMVQPAWFQR